MSYQVPPAEVFGQKVRVYFNLHKKVFSIRYRGRVVGYSPFVRLEAVDFLVSQKGRERVLRRRQKEIHAFVQGKLVELQGNDWEYPENWGNLTAFSYNPYVKPWFYDYSGNPLHSADYVVLVSRLGKPQSRFLQIKERKK